MAELQTTTVSEVAASNNAASPDGMAEGCAPSSVNNTYREGLAAQVRWFNRLSGLDNSRALLSTAGGATVYTLTFTTAPASFFTGFIFGCKINLTCAVNPTLNINGLGATNIQKMTSAGYVNLAAGDLITNQHVWMKYDATLARIILMTPIAAAGSVFTDPMTTRGDVIVRDATNTTARLAVGAAARLLRSDGTDVSWAQVAGATDISGTIPAGNLPTATTAATGIGQLADAAAMEAQTASRIVTADLIQRGPMVPKAWAIWVGATAGTNAPLAGFNVTSIQRVSAGNYVVNFTTSFSSANYCMTHAHMDASSNATGQYLKLVSKTSAAATVRFNVNGAATDVDEVHASFFGDQ